MKKIIVFLVLIFLYIQNSYGWEGIGVNVGGGFYIH
ncbi:MAG: hypothetical protein QG635_1555, partial [Bacteroidota bacterium]|nr:hypothetical protein [Bacteroidota bacterium]